MRGGSEGNAQNESTTQREMVLITSMDNAEKQFKCDIDVMAKVLGRFSF